MYVNTVEVENIRCLRNVRVALCAPTDTDEANPTQNVTVLLGNNGTGKSTLLKSIAVAALAGAIRDIGFVPFFLVSRPVHEELEGPTDSLEIHGMIRGSLQFDEMIGSGRAGAVGSADVLVKLIAGPQGEDRILADELKTPHQPGSDASSIRNALAASMYSNAPGFLVLGYGSNRRVGRRGAESHRMVRRYRRVASLFDEQVSLAPISEWAPSLPVAARRQIAEALDILLGEHGLKVDRASFADGRLQFRQGDYRLPLEALSDGFRGFIGWVSDVLWNIFQDASPSMSTHNATGVVLVDEVDLLLHPSWQRTVVSSISRAFPRLQFVFSTHSPLVASAVNAANLRVMVRNPDGTTGVALIEEESWGKTSDQLLTTVFEVPSSRPPEASMIIKQLASRSRAGDEKASLELLQAITDGPRRSTKTVGPPKRRKRKKGRKA